MNRNTAWEDCQRGMPWHIYRTVNLKLLPYGRPGHGTELINYNKIGLKLSLSVFTVNFYRIVLSDQSLAEANLHEQVYREAGKEGAVRV